MWQTTFLRLITRVYDMAHRTGPAPAKRRAPANISINDVATWIYIVLVLSIATSIAISVYSSLQNPPPEAPPGTVPARVSRWGSADSLWLHDTPVYELHTPRAVRLAGIDAPQTYASEHALAQARRMRLPVLRVVQLGAQARSFAETLLPYGSPVHVEWDPKTTDPVGRHIVFLWTEKLQLVQEEILRAGWADLDPSTAGKHSARLRKARDQAKAAKKGIWKVVR